MNTQCKNFYLFIYSSFSVVQVHPERNEIEVKRPKTNSKDVPDSKVFVFDAVFDDR